MKAAVRADNFQIPVEHLGTLLKFAQQRAQETGESVDYLTESIVNGIGRQSKPILDNLGISAVRLQRKIEETGDFAKAVIAVVNEELAAQGDLALTSADKATQASVKWQNAQRAVGEKLLGIKNVFSQISASTAEWFSAMIEKYLPGMLKWLESTINGMIEFYNTSLLVRIAVQTIFVQFKTGAAIAVSLIKMIVGNIMLAIQGMEALVTLSLDKGKKAWDDYKKHGEMNVRGLKEFLTDTVKDAAAAANKELEKIDITSPLSGNTVIKGKGQTPGAGAGDGEQKKKAMQESLKIIDAMLEKEINLLKERRMEGLLTEQEYNDKVEELTLQALKNKMAIKGQEKQMYIQYESQILDAQIKQQEEADKLLLQELTKVKDEKLKLIDSARNSQLEILQETEKDSKIYALRAQEIEVNAAAAREALIKDFGKQIEQAEFKNALNRQKAIEENSKKIIDAEKSSLKEREALMKKFAKTTADFERLYNIKSWEELRSEEITVIERYREENLISEETYQAALAAIEKKIPG
jgi:hypothetical protein